ncbi:hypothetical protein KQH60_10315 [Mycetohabitans sp. B8]|uniref:hypothetical protein n=1 Tax=Mycetohabitans sp. B8 TaxID=2841845 RepID=UPI001F3898F2|nr:hypothetical protein [Mycetohabitans sp. B8]MCG1042908.1 hypothetical protein [Mycetohabitans sp. B8]
MTAGSFDLECAQFNGKVVGALLYPERMGFAVRGDGLKLRGNQHRARRDAR